MDKRISKIILLLSLISFCFLGYSQEIDETKSSVLFKVKNFQIHTVNGSFAEFDGTIIFNKQYPDSNKVYLNIDVSTINTGISKRDEALQGKKYFNAEHFPDIEFTSSHIESFNDTSFIAHGYLNVKGVTNKINIPFKRNKDHYAGTFILNRLDYSVGNKGTFLIDDEVRISFECYIK